MTGLEWALGGVVVALVVLQAVTFGLLLGARRRVRSLKQRLAEGRRPARPRLSVPTASDVVRTVVGTGIAVKDKGFGGMLRSSIDDLARWADVERPDLARMAAKDGTVTILFSDIENSTALNDRLGDKDWVRLLAKHDRALKKAVAAHAGHVIKTQGDGFMVAFAEPHEAVAAAVQAQRTVTGSARGGLVDVRIRIGAHKGSAVQRDNDLFGRNVAYAARVAAQAGGGEIWVSDAVLAELDPESVVVDDSREVELKGLAGTHVVHEVDWRV